MKKYPIATIVNFCTNESRFLKICLEQARIFSRQVIVPICDHFFDGTSENRPLLEEIYRSFPDCLFIEYPFIPHRLPKKIARSIDPAHFWHSFSRLIASRYLEETIETVLFLDADEVPDGCRFSEWIECSDYLQHTVLKIANYWYFREERFQAKKWEDSIVLAQKRALTPQLLLRDEEREAIYNFLPGPKRRMVVGTDGTPMFHHYSWVRTEEEMLRKVRAWGHRGDRDWEALVKKEFSAQFQGVDFVHGYKFETVEPPFQLPAAAPQFLPAGNGKVIRLTEEEVLKVVKMGKGSRWRTIFSFTQRA